MQKWRIDSYTKRVVGPMYKTKKSQTLLSPPWVDGRRLDEWANQFFIAQESTLSYDSTLLSLLYESASPTVRVRFMPATSIHDSATGEALTQPEILVWWIRIAPPYMLYPSIINFRCRTKFKKHDGYESQQQPGTIPHFLFQYSFFIENMLHMPSKTKYVVFSFAWTKTCLMRVNIFIYFSLCETHWKLKHIETFRSKPNKPHR